MSSVGGQHSPAESAFLLSRVLWMYTGGSSIPLDRGIFAMRSYRDRGRLSAGICRPLPLDSPRRTVDWPGVGNDPGCMRYSQLDQINRENVTRLKPVWTYHTRELEGRTGKTIECTPIVIDGVMYVTTGYLRVVALDAATGKELWQFDPLKDHPFRAPTGVRRRQPRLRLLVRRQARRRAADHSRHVGRTIVFAGREDRQARPEVRRRRRPQSPQGTRSEGRRA